MDQFTFGEPGSLEYINPENLKGKLVIIWPIQYVNPAPPTKFSRPDKVDDAISVDVVTLDLLDDEGRPKVFRAQLWRQSRLIQAFKQALTTGPLLGTLGQGQAMKGNPPWVFISLTHDQSAVAKANEWRAANPDFKPSEPREYTILAPEQPQVQQGHGGGQHPWQQHGYQNDNTPQQGQWQPAHHGAPEAMPQWAQQQSAPQQQMPPYPPQQPQVQQNTPAQLSILERLRQQGQQGGQQPGPQGPDAQQQYGY